MIIGSPANDSATHLYGGKIAVFSSNPNFELVTTVSGNGNVYPPTGLYSPGTNIILSAIPDEVGYLQDGVVLLLIMIIIIQINYNTYELYFCNCKFFK